MILRTINSKLSHVPILIRLGVVLTATILIITSGYLVWENKQNQFHENDQTTTDSSQPQTIQTSNGKIISTQGLIYIPGQVANFSVDANPLRVRTKIRLTYLKPPQPAPIRLHLPMTYGIDPLYKLVDHPIFHNMKWSMIQNEDFSLYQKQPQFETIDQFLNANLSDQKILFDVTIPDDIKQQLDKGQEFNEDYPENYEQEYDFVFTSYKPSIIKDNFYVFETIVDTTQALIKDNKMTFSIYANKVSKQNPLYMKEISVDFVQPGNIINQPQTQPNESNTI